MRPLRHEVTSTATPAAVHAVWADVARWPIWDPEVRSARIDGPFAVGTRGRLVPVRGRPSAFTVTELDAPGRHVLEVDLPLARLRLVRTAAASPGGSVLAHEVTLAGPLGPGFALVLRRRFARALPQAVDGVRRLAEDDDRPE